MDKRIWAFALFSLVSVASFPVWGQGELQHVRRPVLVECDGRPCFRLEFNAVDASGEPVFLTEDTDQLLRHIVVFEEPGKVRRFEAFHLRYLQSGDMTTFEENYSMILLDVSGSMLAGTGEGIATRFDAAKSAIERYIADFLPGIDHVAIAPFESRQVRERIRSAQFIDTKDQVRETLQTLSPSRAGNTALYSAVREALQVLVDRSSQLARGTNFSLIVLTDGQNDISPPADPGLLDDLAPVLELANQAGIQITTIGFGSEGERNFDDTALRKLAWPNDGFYYPASGSVELALAFERARKVQTNRMRLTFGPVRESKDQLAGWQDLRFDVQIDLEEGQKLSGLSPVWSGIAYGSPAFEDRLDSSERTAMQRMGLGPEGLGRGPSRLGRIVVFLGFSLLLGFLWFVLPRLIWVYQPQHQTQPVSRPGVRREPLNRSKPAPRDFESHERDAYDATRAFRNPWDE